MDGVGPTVLIGWALAALLFMLSLRAVRRGALAVLTGMAAVVAVTLYSHDVIPLPEICGALIVGGLAGLVLAREVPLSALPALLAGLIGQLGLAALFIGIAAWRNPHAFGLLDEATNALTQAAGVAIGLGSALGAMTFAGAVTALWRGGVDGVALGRAGFLAVPLLLLTGLLVAWFALHPSSLLLSACAGVALLSGHRLAQGVMHIGMGPVLALLGGLSGWSGAVMGFLLENMAMVVAGGLAGAAGSMIAARLRGGAGRKGLADRERRP